MFRCRPITTRSSGIFIFSRRRGEREGKISGLQEGGGESALPKQEQKVACAKSPAAAAPLASFTRSNSGWMVNVSLPEAATQFGYRVGEDGEFTDPGFIDALDQRTGARMPKTYFEMPPDQGKTTIYVTWRDKRGEQAEVFPINFDPNAALAGEQKATLEQFWTSWIALREFQGMKVYFTHLITFAARSRKCATATMAERPTRCSSCPIAIPPTRIACLTRPRCS